MGEISCGFKAKTDVRPSDDDGFAGEAGARVGEGGEELAVEEAGEFGEGNDHGNCWWVVNWGAGGCFGGEEAWGWKAVGEAWGMPGGVVSLEIRLLAKRAPREMGP